LGVYVAVLYIVIVWFFRPDSATGCRDASWLVFSGSWFCLSLCILGLGIRAFQGFSSSQGAPRRQSDLRYVTKTSLDEEMGRRFSDDDVEGRIASHGDMIFLSGLQDKEPHGSRIERIGSYDVSPRLPSIHVTCTTLNDQSYLDDRKKGLLVLIIVETFCAFVTMVWDFVVIWSLTDPKESCEFFLRHIPSLEISAYVVTRTMTVLVPHWAVLYVFYWVERRNYEPLRRQWDVNMPPIPVQQEEQSTSDANNNIFAYISAKTGETFQI